MKKNANLRKYARIYAMHQGKNPKDLWLTAESSGDPGIYHEMRISAENREGECIADIMVGLDEHGELRVLITANGDGDGDHAIAVFPERAATASLGKPYIERW